LSNSERAAYGLLATARNLLKNNANTSAAASYHHSVLAASAISGSGEVWSIHWKTLGFV
jgi:hypothetical protein